MRKRRTGGCGKTAKQPKYSVKSAYSILKDEEKGEGVPMYESFWRIKAQPSAHLTAWRALEEK